MKEHKSVEDSIFDAFMGEEENEEEGKKEEVKIETALKLRIEDLALRAAQIYSKRKFPHLALYMIRAEPSIIQESNLVLERIDSVYIEKMVLSMLQTIIKDTLSNKELVSCADRYRVIITALEYFNSAFGTSMYPMKKMVIETLSCSYTHLDLLYWHIQNRRIEQAFSILQKDAIELAEFIKRIVENLFYYDVLASKEGTKQTIVGIFNYLDRLFNLMEMIENELELSKSSPSKSSKDNDSKKTFKVSDGLHKGFTKMKMQVSFLLYVGLVMLSYSCNKFYRTIVLLSQLSMIFQNKSFSWKGYVHDKLATLIDKYRRTVNKGKTRFFSSVKIDIMASPGEYNKRKGVEFFGLWARYILIKKLMSIIEIQQNFYKENPDSIMFKMKESKLYMTKLYEKQSYSLFQ